MAVNKVVLPDLAFAACPRCGGIRVEGDAADQWFHWLQKYGWQGAVQWIITHCAWGVLAWRGSRRDPDGRVICLLVEDEHLAAALTEVLERIEAGRTRPVPPPTSVVTWEEWAPAAAVTDSAPLLGPVLCAQRLEADLARRDEQAQRAAQEEVLRHARS